MAQDAEQVEAIEVSQPDGLVEAPQELSDVEKEASTKGWKPDGPKSAEEFLRAEPLYEEIKASHKEIRELKTAIGAMRDMMTKREQQAYQQALNDIKAQRDEAITLGDVSRVHQLDTQVENISRDLTQYNQPQMTPKVQEFINRNKSWLDDNSEEALDMKLMAEAKYITLKNQGKSDEEIVDYVEKTLQRAFPSRFDKPVKAATPVVEGSSSELRRGAHQKSKFSFNDLNAEQKKICRSLEKAKLMTAEEYVQELVKVGELKQ